jgi:hypothetical protein
MAGVSPEVSPEAASERAGPPPESPEPSRPQDRLEELLGTDLARFLIAALSVDGQGRRGSASP